MAAVLQVSKGSSIWAWVRVGLLGLVGMWYLVDLARTLVSALEASGPGGILETVFLYRLGEALVTLGFAYCLQAKHRETSFLRMARWVILCGAVLAGISFVGLVGRIAWAPLAVLTALAGILLARQVGLSTGCATRFTGWLGMTALLLLHLLGYTAGFLFHGYAVEPFPAAFPLPASTRDERWRQDTRYLGSELVRLHANAFHTTPEDTYWNLIENLENTVPEMTDAQITIEMMRIVATVGDAHTQFSAGRKIALHALPVDLRWYRDGLYMQGISPKYPEALGARVVRIGALASEEVYQAVLPLISHENDFWARLKSSNYLNVVEILKSVGAVEDAGAVRLTLENSSGGDFQVEIAPLGPGEKVDYLSAIEEPLYYQSQPERSFWFEYREKSHTLYFRYAACIDPGGFRSLMGDLWKLADEKPVERLIVDLRGNGGGNSLQFEQFFMPDLETNPALNQPERLFALIDRGTFSSASDNAVYLRLHSRATFVGEPTGGKPNSYGEVRSFRLPNSRASVSYSTRYFQLIEADPPFVEPDIRVAVDAQQAFAGRDPVLEMIAPEEDW